MRGGCLGILTLGDERGRVEFISDSASKIAPAKKYLLGGARKAQKQRAIVAVAGGVARGAKGAKKTYSSELGLPSVRRGGSPSTKSTPFTTSARLSFGSSGLIYSWLIEKE